MRRARVTYVSAAEMAQKDRDRSDFRVRDERPRDAEHAQIPGEGPRAELGQLPVEAREQVVADLPNLFSDEIVVCRAAIRPQA